jgi:geranylgeranyl diphosphate synthase, type I
MAASELIRTSAETLAWGRELVDSTLRSAVDGLGETARLVAGYHAGWWDEHGAPVAGGSGKAVRPTLVLLSAAAVGGDPRDAVPAAAAVELVHDFSLLHDDVMDGDATRRHRPAAWRVFGVNAAILAGDALLTLALEVAGGRGLAILAAAVRDLVDGQCADLSFERRGTVTVAECEAMSRQKTGALTGACCALGALFGGGSRADVDRLREFGERVGLAYQHVDDLLGIWGDPAVTGKPVHSDLVSRKKSLPVVAALHSGTDAGAELARLYRRDATLTDAEVTRAAELVELAGGRAWSRQQTETLLDEALARLGTAGGAAAELAGLAALLTRRDH